MPFLVRAPEFLSSNAELPQDAVVQGRSNLASAVDRDRHGSSVAVDPSLMTAGLSSFLEAQSPLAETLQLER